MDSDHSQQPFHPLRIPSDNSLSKRQRQKSETVDFRPLSSSAEFFYVSEISGFTIDVHVFVILFRVSIRNSRGGRAGYLITDILQTEIIVSTRGTSGQTSTGIVLARADIKGIPRQLPAILVYTAAHSHLKRHIWNFQDCKYIRQRMPFGIRQIKIRPPQATQDLVCSPRKKRRRMIILASG